MCVLWVSGRDFDPERFLATSTLKTLGTWRRGDPRRLGRRHTDSGFSVDVSSATWRNLDRQAADAVRFLSKHRRELLRLRRFRGLEDLTLSFALDLRIDFKRVAVQSDLLNRDLISAAGELGVGISISIWPTSIPNSRKTVRKRVRSRAG